MYSALFWPCPGPAPDLETVSQDVRMRCRCTVYLNSFFIFRKSNLYKIARRPRWKCTALSKFSTFFRKLAIPGFSRGTRQRLNPQRVQASIFFVLVMAYSRLGLFLYRAPLVYRIFRIWILIFLPAHWKSNILYSDRGSFYTRLYHFFAFWCFGL